jgi:hypothetical protein
LYREVVPSRTVGTSLSKAETRRMWAVDSLQGKASNTPKNGLAQDASLLQ